MNEVYDWQVPGTWVEIYDDIFIPAMIATWLPRLAAQVGLQLGERVLDVPCGTGEWTHCAAAQVEPQGRVVGLDISPEMLAAARRQDGVGPGEASIEWREGAADALPDRSGAGDGAPIAFLGGLMPDDTHPPRLVSTQWAADHLADPTVRFAEIVWGDSDEWGTAAYHRGHVPGAVAWEFATELQDPARNDITDQTGIEVLFGRSGVTPATTVVVYSGLSNLLAAFAFWLLKVYGHRDVRLLDGGRSKWLAEGRPLSAEPPVSAPTVYRAQPAIRRLRSHRADVLQAIGQPDHLLVDARSSEMFSGADLAGAIRGGRIPGAVNLAAQRETTSDGLFKAWRVPTVRQDGNFKSAAELRTLVENLGITPDKAIITYCVRGGLSTHAWFVLTQLLGYPDVREYDRSWVEWGNSIELPIERG